MEDSYSFKYIKRLCIFMFQTCSNSLLCTDSQYSSQQLTIGASLKHKSTQPLYIFNRENPQNSEPQNGPRSGLDYIALPNTQWGGDSKTLIALLLPNIFLIFYIFYAYKSSGHDPTRYFSCLCRKFNELRVLLFLRSTQISQNLKSIQKCPCLSSLKNKFQ